MTSDVLARIVRWLAKQEIAHARECGEASGICRGFAEGWNAATNHLRPEVDAARAELDFIRAVFPLHRSSRKSERIH